MKKKLLIICTMLLMLTFSACSKNDENITNTIIPSTSSPTLATIENTYSVLPQYEVTFATIDEMELPENIPAQYIPVYKNNEYLNMADEVTVKQITYFANAKVEDIATMYNNALSDIESLHSSGDSKSHLIEFVYENWLIQYSIESQGDSTDRVFVSLVFTDVLETPE